MREFSITILGHHKWCQRLIFYQNNQVLLHLNRLRNYIDRRLKSKESRVNYESFCWISNSSYFQIFLNLSISSSRRIRKWHLKDLKTNASTLRLFSHFVQTPSKVVFKGLQCSLSVAPLNASSQMWRQSAQLVYPLIHMIWYNLIKVPQQLNHKFKLAPPSLQMLSQPFRPKW